MKTYEDFRLALSKATDLRAITALSGVNRVTIRRIVNGLHKPNMDTFERLSAALKGRRSEPKRDHESAEKEAA